MTYAEKTLANLFQPFSSDPEIVKMLIRTLKNFNVDEAIFAEMLLDVITDEILDDEDQTNALFDIIGRHIVAAAMRKTYNISGFFDANLIVNPKRSDSGVLFNDHLFCDKLELETHICDHYQDFKEKIVAQVKYVLN